MLRCEHYEDRTDLHFAYPSSMFIVVVATSLYNSTFPRTRVSRFSRYASKLKWYVADATAAADVTTAVTPLAVCVGWSTNCSRTCRLRNTPSCRRRATDWSRASLKLYTTHSHRLEQGFTLYTTHSHRLEQGFLETLHNTQPQTGAGLHTLHNTQPQTGAGLP